ncbi:hypothetical protein [Heliophilum fasciatum]|uniref:Uncharacterized protein n=1 Tax=Heliophilum fasciatum TaxID=35700 RepID=A0A4R2RIJ1_9FIRM|nr:hypothetical protein [Heliophilum fasciatum]MCW2278733.1 hypothetical protein [Heliophilum fasciatum]TCP62528.1 hypothetical protein EDD73_12126 [Heliophilum fasciatum]
MAKYRVTTPNPTYSGVTDGVLFVIGEAIVEDEQKRFILVNDYGYACEPVEEVKQGESKKVKPAAQK